MRHDSFKVRPAEAEDIPEIGRIVVRSWQHTFDGLVSAEIGFCSGGPSRRSTYPAESEVYAIYLMPGFERRGIGGRLFQNVVVDIAASGRKGLFLTALSVNPNRSFYTNLGGVEAEAESLQLGNEIYPQIAFVWDDLPEVEAEGERK